MKRIFTRNVMEMYLPGTLSVLEIAGLDARQFLHNQLSSDILSLPAGGSVFSCYCNPAGRVLGLLLVIAREDSFYVLCASELAKQLRERMRKFIIREDVRIESRPDLTVTAALEHHTGQTGVCADTDPGLTYCVAGSEDTGRAGEPDQRSAWKAIELQAGVLWLDNRTSGHFLPQMLGFDSIGALNFRKGCFPGQEIIARTRYLGKLKRRPLLVRVDGPVNVDVMEKLEVRCGDETFSAVVADQAPGDDQLLFLVVRAAEEIDPDSLVIGAGSPVAIKT